MNAKDTTITLTINQDNSDLDDFPNQYVQQRMEYDGPQWTQVVEDILRVLELHYKYPIRDKVYYAVNLPIFDHNISSAPGRELDRALFLKVLEENPKLNNGGEHQPYNPEFDFKE